VHVYKPAISVAFYVAPCIVYRRGYVEVPLVPLDDIAVNVVKQHG